MEQQISLFEHSKPKDIRDHEIFDDIRPHILERFWVYHGANPHIFDLYLKFARQVRQAGFKRYGTKAITERIRWYVDVETKGDTFKINDNYHSCYARLLIVSYPEEFENFFETRSPQRQQEIFEEVYGI